MFYGSFGAGIATLVWLYISAFSVLIGAELNGAVYRERQANIAARARFEDEGSGR
jgi:membrane protein